MFKKLGHMNYKTASNRFQWLILRDNIKETFGCLVTIKDRTTGEIVSTPGGTYEFTTEQQARQAVVDNMAFIGAIRDWGTDK